MGLTSSSLYLFRQAALTGGLSITLLISLSDCLYLHMKLPCCLSCIHVIKDQHGQQQHTVQTSGSGVRRSATKMSLLERIEFLSCQPHDLGDPHDLWVEYKRSTRGRPTSLGREHATSKGGKRLQISDGNRRLGGDFKAVPNFHTTFGPATRPSARRLKREVEYRHIGPDLPTPQSTRALNLTRLRGDAR